MARLAARLRRCSGLFGRSAHAVGELVAAHTGDFPDVSPLCTTDGNPTHLTIHLQIRWDTDGGFRSVFVNLDNNGFGFAVGFFISELGAAGPYDCGVGGDLDGLNLPFQTQGAYCDAASTPATCVLAI